MNFLEERIVRDGQVRSGEILKVDSFLNHQLDVALLDEIGKTFYEKYKDRGITRIDDWTLFPGTGGVCQEGQE